MKYKVLKQKLKSTKGEFFVYRFLSNKCKCVYNKAIENITISNITNRYHNQILEILGFLYIHIIYFY